MGTHLIIRKKEEAGQQVRGLSWKEKRPRSSTPMRCSCSYGRSIPRIIMKIVRYYESGMMDEFEYIDYCIAGDGYSF